MVDAPSLAVIIHPPGATGITSSIGFRAACTDLNNLTFLCRYHHTHFLQKGWACQMNPDGLPEWIPPKWIDREQRPQINARIRRLNTQHELGRLRRPPAAA